MPRLLTTSEAADALRVSEQTIRSYIKQNILHAKQVKRRWLIPEDALQAFINEPPQQGSQPNE